MSQPWQDRRGMFQAGKVVHEPGRRLSSSQGSGGVIDAVRRASISSIGDNPLSKTATNDSASGASPSSTAASRRRSSAGRFGNLEQHKRGSEDYATRRAGHSDQMTGGALSGWFNSTFRGMKKAEPGSAQEGDIKKRGVME